MPNNERELIWGGTAQFVGETADGRIKLFELARIGATRMEIRPPFRETFVITRFENPDLEGHGTLVFPLGKLTGVIGITKPFSKYDRYELWSEDERLGLAFGPNFEYAIAVAMGIDSPAVSANASDSRIDENLERRLRGFLRSTGTF